MKLISKNKYYKILELKVRGKPKNYYPNLTIIRE